ncbi:MAG TPA: VanW family protein [Tissierellaceae bacterium]|jgi:vancomycin resistance protein YoaR|nr:VanW family protein [Tissierellaceae bacterium]
MKKGSIIAIAVVLVLTVTGMGGYYYLDNYLSGDTFYEGVTIDGRPMGGLTLEEGIHQLQESKEEDLERIIVLKVDGESEYHSNLTLRNLQLEYNIQEVATEAFQMGRRGNVLQRYTEIRNLEKNPVSFNLERSFKLENLAATLEELAAKVDREPIDAKFNFKDGDMEIIEASEGIALDIETFMTDVSNMGEGILDGGTLYIPVKIIQPELEEDYYSKINGIIGEFSTSFAGSSAGRSHNIRLSAQSFDGMLLMPGQEVSYNRTTGPRQASAGYREAPVIENGELIPGMGGGVCQTSTTLYNALLLADMTILERRPHSIPPAYVPRGTDAAVATGYLDLVFRNDFDYPVLIDTKVEGTRVYFYIYGDQKNRDYSVRISTSQIATTPYRVHENLDNGLEPGARELVQEGRNGYKVNTFKSIVRNGEVVSTQLISQDYYRERDYIYKIGPTPVTEQQIQEPEQVVPQVEEPAQVEEQEQLQEQESANEGDDGLATPDPDQQGAEDPTGSQ